MRGCGWTRSAGARVGGRADAAGVAAATAKTVEAWLARAEQRAIKHLHEEVKAAELVGRVIERGDVAPPDAETMSAVAELETAVVSGRVYRERFEAGEAWSAWQGQARAGGCSVT